MPVQSPQTRVPADRRGVRSSMRKRGNIETGVQDNGINRRRRSALSSKLRLMSEHPLEATLSNRQRRMAA